ncbi:hypothetical protein D1B31_23800 [Neobacillus notoginsengisoli]|uniref:Uncharacterized protein n=1 Tax=Neobacillus notoginsengisoli TaxID=1578198 RepID=A0A417YCH8_9BACI|nr:hypothetical protein D1B31_23800 [Neobacillus notoginsengisoli]
MSLERSKVERKGVHKTGKGLSEEWDMTQQVKLVPDPDGVQPWLGTTWFICQAIEGDIQVSFCAVDGSLKGALQCC